MSDDVDVVVGVILSGDKFLVEPRGLDEKIDPCLVCLLGGHVRINEKHEGIVEERTARRVGVST